jgi:hypothetical protein
VVTWSPAVLEELFRHGLQPGDGETPAALRERLNDRYLEDVRALRARQVSGDIPLREYASHVQALKDRYPLLGLPLSAWGRRP